MWYGSVEKCFFENFDGKSPTSRENVHDNIFIFARNKGLIRTMITTSRINLFTGTIFRHGKLLFVLWTGFAVLTLLWTNGKWNCKTFFIKYYNTSYSYKNIQRIWIIRSFQTYCQLSTFNTRNVPFKTRFTSLAKTQKLTASLSLKIIRITSVTIGAITDLKLFWGGVLINRLRNDEIVQVIKWSIMCTFDKAKPS